ncbi:MAG: hypothetical protein P8046_10145 [Anaerolineales bacterium]
MQDDVRKLIFGVLGLFILVIVGWVGFVFFSGCGLSLDCEKGARIPERTPIPTLIPAALPIIQQSAEQPKVACQVTAVNLIGAWVNAGYSDTESFEFTDINGQTCTANFHDDVQQLFLEGNIWFTGAPACTTCHNASLENAGMDLSSYEAMLAGSRRASADVTGNDIFGGGVFESSLLYKMLYLDKLMPLGRPADSPAEGPIIFAGSTQTTE